MPMKAIGLTTVTSVSTSQVYPKGCIHTLTYISFVVFNVYMSYQSNTRPELPLANCYDSLVLVKDKCFGELQAFHKSHHVKSQCRYTKSWDGLGLKFVIPSYHPEASLYGAIRIFAKFWPAFIDIHGKVT